jgi:long-chain fatty acid transport protein
LNDKAVVSVAASVFFGLSTKYKTDSIVRYRAVESKIAAPNLNPTLAWRFNPKVAVGVGVILQHVDVTLSTMVMTALAPIIGDTFLKFQGKAWGVGANAGLLYEPYVGTRIGLSVRSPIKHVLKGHVHVENAGVFATSSQTALFRDGPIKASLKTPPIANLSVAQRLSDHWTLLGDVMWTGWKVFKEIAVKRRDVAEAYTPEVQHWKDVFMYSVGARFRPLGKWDRWTFLTGVAYDCSPVRDAHRSPRLPDADRIWASAAVEYKIPESNIGFKLAYSHVMAKKAKIDVSSPGNLAVVPTRLQGHFKSRVDIVSAQLTYRF